MAAEGAGAGKRSGEARSSAGGGERAAPRGQQQEQQRQQQEQPAGGAGGHPDAEHAAHSMRMSALARAFKQARPPPAPALVGGVFCCAEETGRRANRRWFMTRLDACPSAARRVSPTLPGPRMEGLLGRPGPWPGARPGGRSRWCTAARRSRPRRTSASELRARRRSSSATTATTGRRSSSHRGGWESDKKSVRAPP